MSESGATLCYGSIIVISSIDKFFGLERFLEARMLAVVCSLCY